MQSLDFGTGQYIWPLLNSLFSEVLPKDDFLRLLDHLFTHKDEPELLLAFCAAFLLSSRSTLLSI